jgi:hypothetical protein
VGATAQLQVLDAGRAAVRERHHMMEFQKRALLAPAVGDDKRALVRITRPHGSADRGWHMPRVCRGRCRGPRASNGPALLALELFQEQADGHLEEDCGIAIWNRVAGEFLHSTQRIVRLARNRKLEPEALR